MRHKIFFWIILLIGLWARLYHAWAAPFAYVNCDTSTVWLMARHILHGEFPLFFYGQYYLGPLEALAVALFWLIFGIKISTLYFGTIFFSVLFSVSAYFLGKELRDKATGLLTMLYCSLPPFYFFWESISPLGYHIEIPLLGNILFILTLKVCREERQARKSIYYVFLGICAGIGVWTHYIILYYFLPIALYLIANEKWKNLLKNSIPAILGFFLAGLPFWIFTFTYNFVTFRFKSRGGMPCAGLMFLKSFLSHINDMLSVDYIYNPASGILKEAVFYVYVLCILFFIVSSFFRQKFTPLESLAHGRGASEVNARGLKPRASFFVRKVETFLTGFIFNKSSIFVYLFIFIIVLYVWYRSRSFAGEGYNYLISIITFVSIVFGYCGSCLWKYSKTAGLCFIGLVIGFNLSNISREMVKNEGLSKTMERKIYEQINFLETNGIFHFTGYERSSRVPVFLSGENIIATGFMDGEYFPYEDKVEESDRTAFEAYGSDWRSTLNNICESYDFQSEFFYNFKPHPYKAKVIPPVGWHAYANNNARDARYAFDRNYDNYWMSRGGKKCGMDFTVDTGRLHSLCKIEIYNADKYSNYPYSCKIQVSPDGKIWQDVGYIENVQTFFWSGPRLYWHLVDGRLEWFFKPVCARYVRLVSMGEDKNNPWIINEIYLYEYAGSKKYKTRDYIKEAKDIVNFLRRNGIDFAYADFWLSAKIRQMAKDKINPAPSSGVLDLARSIIAPFHFHSKPQGFRGRGGIKALVPYNAYLPPKENTSRRVYLNSKKALVVRNGDTSELEGILKEFNLSFRKQEFKNYVCYYFPEMNKKFESISSLMWIGTGLVKYSLKEYSNWLYGLGRYEEALKYYPNNFLAYLHAKFFPSTKYFPQVNVSILFANDVQFLGYSVRTKKIIPGKTIRIEYFWDVQKEPKDSISIFVYFEKDGRIVFQNDHKFLYQFSRPLSPLKEERFREILKLKIPGGIGRGAYKVIIGLWDENTKKRIHIKDAFGTRDTKRTVGELVVS